MCGSLFHSPKIETPKVEKVAPAPQAVTQSETAAMSDRAATENKRRRATRGADWARTRANDSVLTDTATSGNRQTLG